MKTYTVYINPKSKNPQEDAEFVPEGFSLLMFLPIINIAVAAYRRCWLLLMMIVAIEFFTYFASESEFFNTHIFSNAIPWKLNMAMRLVLLFFFGLWVNDFWRQKLEKRGYELAGIISVPSGWHSLSYAQQRFYDKMAGATK